MAEKKTTKKTEEKKVKKTPAVKKETKKKVAVAEEVKEVKIEAKLENIDFGLPTIAVDDDDFVVNEDDFKDLGDKYFEATGRRKTANARVRLYTKGDKGIEVNGMDFTKYFPTKDLQANALASLDKMKSLERFRVTAKVSGGGISAQAEAVRHGIARALVVFNADYRKRLRKAGYLTRDPRMKERKKPGLRRARRAPQWSKR